MSGRPRIVSPLYERLKAHRAVFGSKLGWERPNWFAPEGVEPKDVYSMGRQNWFAAGRRRAPACAREGRHLRPVVLRQIRADRHGRAEGARLDLRQRCRQAGRPADLHAASQHARRHRGRPDRGAARRGQILHRHRHRLPHARSRLDRRPYRRGARRDADRRHRGFRHAVADGAAAPATCWLRSPMPMSRTPASRSAMSARSPSPATRCGRCASPMSANSAGNCMCRSPPPARCSTR